MDSQICSVEFASSPGSVERRLVHVDSADKAIYIEQSSGADVQDPPFRISIPQSTFHVEGLGLFCSSSDSGQAVTISFDSRAEIQAFAAKVRAMNSSKTKPDKVDVQLGHVGARVERSTSTFVHQPRTPAEGYCQIATPPPAQTERGTVRSEAHTVSPPIVAPPSDRRPASHIQSPVDIDRRSPRRFLSQPVNVDVSPQSQHPSLLCANVDARPPKHCAASPVSDAPPSLPPPPHSSTLPQPFRPPLLAGTSPLSLETSPASLSTAEIFRAEDLTASEGSRSSLPPVASTADRSMISDHARTHSTDPPSTLVLARSPADVLPPRSPAEPLSSIPERKGESEELDRGSARWDGLNGLQSDAQSTQHAHDAFTGLSLDAHAAARSLLDWTRPPSSFHHANGLDREQSRSLDRCPPPTTAPSILDSIGSSKKTSSLRLSPVSVSRRTLLAPAPAPESRPPGPNVIVMPDLTAGSPLAIGRTSSMWALPERHADAELLQSFLEDRCSVGSDPKGADAATLLLRRKTAGEACSALLVPTLSEKTKLIKVVEEFQDHGNVLVCRTRSHAEDIVISRDGFLRRVLMTGIQDLSYAEWERAALPAVGIQKPPSLRIVNRSDKLSEVLGGMLAGGALEVAVAGKDGKVIGVLSRDNIFAMVATEYIVDHTIRERMEKGSVSVMCDLQYEEDIEEQEQTLSMPRLQRAAADVLESASTKTVLSMALLGDILVECYDSFSHFPCVDCKSEWETSEAYEDHGESDVPFRSYVDCRDRVWLSDCEKIASVTNPINMWATVSLITFFLETMLRIYAYRGGLLNRYIELFDTLLVWLMCATFLALFAGNEGDPKRNTDLRWVIAVARCMRIIRFIRVANKLRNVVGKEKTRYQKDGFDLDLSYITETCVAMSLPATGLEAKFRNPMDEVVRFFRQKHQAGTVPHYLIYNLCQERRYSPLLFDGNVEEYPTEDHNPCILEHICDFVESADRFISAHARNTIAVHCKGGKGRTGMMVVCWLLYSGFSSSRMKDAEQDALEWFALRRTGSEAKHKQGVGQPSQRRYITYFRQAMSSGGFRTPFLKLVKIVMHTCPSHESSCDPWFLVEHNYREVFDSAKQYGVQKMTRRQASMEFACNTLVNGDIRITFYAHKEFPSRDEKIFFLWFHTGFIEENHLSLGKSEIDGASRDKHNKVFKNDFRIELFFEPVTHSRVPYRKLERVSREVLERTRQMSVRMRHQVVRQDPTVRALATADGVVATRPARFNHRLGQARFQDAGFDLDLTYVTDHMIAIAHPGLHSDGPEVARYRSELKRFFLLKHTNAFRIYNLCPEPERSLDDLFPGSSRHYPCLDRHPPPLETIAELTEDCMQFMNFHTDNVAVFCCDSGKARSGVMICAMLIAKDVFATSRQAIEYFNRMRGGGEFTFQNPSQVRYIHHCETIIHLAKDGIATPMGERSVPIILEEVRLWTSEEDKVLKAADEVFIDVRTPETWNEPTNGDTGHTFRTKSSGSGDGERPRRLSILSNEAASDVAESESEDREDVEREFIDFEPPAAGERVPVAGDVRLSIMATTKGNTRKHLSVVFHTSMAGVSYSDDIDIVDFSNSQVEHHDELSTTSSPGKGQAVARSFAMRLQIAFSRPQRHPLAGLEARINKKRSVRKTASMTSTMSNADSASKVLDLSSSIGQRHQANQNLKDALPS